MNQVKFTVEIQYEEQAWQLAQFLKRVSFHDALRLTDGSNDKDQAYAMIDGILGVQRGLREAGFNPR